MTRVSWMAALAGVAALAGANIALAQGTNDGPATDPTANGGNSIINSGDGSGTGTETPGPGMTLKEGENPKPHARPIENGGNITVNKGAGSGTGTAEPQGMK